MLRAAIATLCIAISALADQASVVGFDPVKTWFPSESVLDMAVGVTDYYCRYRISDHARCTDDLVSIEFTDDKILISLHPLLLRPIPDEFTIDGCSLDNYEKTIIPFVIKDAQNELRYIAVKYSPDVNDSVARTCETFVIYFNVDTGYIGPDLGLRPTRRLSKEMLERLGAEWRVKIEDGIGSYDKLDPSTENRVLYVFGASPAETVLDMVVGVVDYYCRYRISDQALSDPGRAWLCKKTVLIFIPLLRRIPDEFTIDGCSLDNYEKTIIPFVIKDAQNELRYIAVKYSPDVNDSVARTCETFVIYFNVDTGYIGPDLGLRPTMEMLERLGAEWRVKIEAE